MYELECKLRLADPEGIAARLAGLGAEYHGAVFERNWVFDRKGELCRKSELLRLRVLDGNGWGVLTHKRPVEGTPYKCRIETETRVENAENARHIFESLGYAGEWYYEKRRRSWNLRGLEVVIDELPQLGFFLEIEAESAEAIDGLLAELGLRREENIMSNYRQLWCDYCAERNLPCTDWKF